MDGKVVMNNIQFFAKGFESPFPLNTVIKENEKDYPENRMFGDNLPAYGFYLRHVKTYLFNKYSFILQAKNTVLHSI